MKLDPSGDGEAVEGHVTNDAAPDSRMWLDGDATPRDVKDIVYRAAHRLTHRDGHRREPARADPARPSDDQCGAGRRQPRRRGPLHRRERVPGDIAITADIPLAAILVAARVEVIDPRGYEHTAETVGERLSVRDFADALRTAGVETGGPRPFSAKDKQAFASALDRALTRVRRSRLT